MAERVFVTGASGYIGGAVAVKLVESGYEVKGLTRSPEKGEELTKRGILPVIGALSDVALLAKCAKEADIVIDAADADNAVAVKALIDALAGSGKVFIHTSGSSIVSDQAAGEPSQRVYSEDTQYKPEPAKQGRVDLDNEVIDSAKKSIRSAVICPCLIYGRGAGVNPESQQVPTLIKQAIKSGVVRCVGRGENTWSTIHIEDLANLYLTVVQKAPGGGVFFFAESAEVRFKDMAEKIREALRIKQPVEEWPIEKAIEAWGRGAAVYALGSNSRIRGERVRKLGWKPTRESVLDDIARCCQHFAVSARK